MTINDNLPNIEILTINDKDSNLLHEEGILITPNERMVVNQVIEIWKLDPATESLGISKLHSLVKANQPNWSLSEKRLKTLLKSYGLLANQPKFTYVNEIKSSITPNLKLPDNLMFQVNKNKGKGIFAKRPILKGTLLWEETPFIFIPPLDHITLMKHGKACSLCGKLLNSRLFSSTSFLNGLDCKYCEELWCSKNCKKNDNLHLILNHNKKKTKINSATWKAYTDFCLENSWNAAFAVGIIRINEVVDNSGLVKKQFDSFAKISQDIRFKASDNAIGTSNDGGLFIMEQQELLWHKGNDLLNQVFLGNEDKLSYKDYLTYLGTYNINNIESLYLTQSHLNHNCDKNVEVKINTDGIKVFAAKDIKANEELVTSYVNPNHNVNQRKRELRINWGFVCGCNKCKLEEKELQRLQSIKVEKIDDKKDDDTEKIDKPLKSPRKSSIKSLDNQKDIKEMLKNVSNEEFELNIPNNSDLIPGRRKSVRFDEKVVAVSDNQ